MSIETVEVTRYTVYGKHRGGKTRAVVRGCREHEAAAKVAELSSGADYSLVWYVEKLYVLHYDSAIKGPDRNQVLDHALAIKIAKENRNANRKPGKKRVRRKA